MEEELNIAAILKDKPKGTKLWSPIVGDCIFNGINSENGAIIASFINKDGEIADWDFNEYGKTLSASKKAEVCLFPSKQMRDLQKFAWKKGDVLAVAGENIHVLFLHWASNDYTRFRCKDEETLTELENDTKDFVSVSDEEAKKTIKAIEESYNGKLNLETLTIEYTKPEFKDGDILHNDETDYNFETIFIANKHDNTIGTYAFLVVHNEDLYIKYEDFDESGKKAIRPATESEKQQLFSALAKEGKRWNPDTKTIEDLPKKCEFKPKDWCLMRNFGEKWKLCQYGFNDKEDEYEASYNAIGGNWYNECIPYNEETAHLLGTTDEYKPKNK